jgi:hypothetical protein
MQPADRDDRGFLQGAAASGLQPVSDGESNPAVQAGHLEARRLLEEASEQFLKADESQPFRWPPSQAPSDDEDGYGGLAWLWSTEGYGVAPSRASNRHEHRTVPWNTWADDEDPPSRSWRRWLPRVSKRARDRGFQTRSERFGVRNPLRPAYWAARRYRRAAGMASHGALRSASPWGWLGVGRRGVGVLAAVGLLPWGLARRARYSAALAERLVGWAVAWLPEPFRNQYEAEWLAESDWLQAHRCPLLGWAFRVLASAVFTRLELRGRLQGAVGRVRTVPQLPVVRVVRQLKPVWLGILTAAGVFCAAAVGWSGTGQHGPSRAQLVWAILASLLTAGGVVWQAWPRGPVAEEPCRADEPDPPAGP